jgi:hypothetical protein
MKTDRIKRIADPFQLLDQSENVAEKLLAKSVKFSVKQQ